MESNKPVSRLAEEFGIAYQIQKSRVSVKEKNKSF